MRGKVLKLTLEDIKNGALQVFSPMLKYGRKTFSIERA